MTQGDSQSNQDGGASKRWAVGISCSKDDHYKAEGQQQFHAKALTLCNPWTQSSHAIFAIGEAIGRQTENMLFYVNAKVIYY